MTGEQFGGLEVARIIACHLPQPDCPDTVCIPATITAGDLRAVYAALTAPAEPAEARIRELEALLEQAGRYQAEFRDRATAAEAKLARAVEGLQRMEWACEQLASTRSSAAYEQMISDGQAQELLELDNARREARQTLAALQQEGE